MKIIDKFNAGFDIGVKAKATNRKHKKAETDVYKSAVKWEKKVAKEERRAEKKAAKEMKKGNKLS